MEDIISASTVSGRNKQKLTITRTIPLEGGGSESKSVVEANMGRHTISLIERHDNSEEYIKNWKFFKDAGMPVVPTCRESSRNTVLVTNLKADGSDLYGKGRWAMEKFPKEARTPHPLDGYFLELTEEGKIEEIRQRVNELVKKADENNLSLPPDDAFELLVHPDNTWELITIDLTYADKANDSGGEVARARAVNRRASDKFIENLQNLREILLKDKK